MNATRIALIPVLTTSILLVACGPKIPECGTQDVVKLATQTFQESLIKQAKTLAPEEEEKIARVKEVIAKEAVKYKIFPLVEAMINSSPDASNSIKMTLAVGAATGKDPVTQKEKLYFDFIERAKPMAQIAVNKTSAISPEDLAKMTPEERLSFESTMALYKAIVSNEAALLSNDVEISLDASASFALSGIASVSKGNGTNINNCTAIADGNVERQMLVKAKSPAALAYLDWSLINGSLKTAKATKVADEFRLPAQKSEQKGMAVQFKAYFTEKGDQIVITLGS